MGPRLRRKLALYDGHEAVGLRGFTNVISMRRVREAVMRPAFLVLSWN
jgi:hypothetical protein